MKKEKGENGTIVIVEEFRFFGTVIITYRSFKFGGFYIQKSTGTMKLEDCKPFDIVFLI